MQLSKTQPASPKMIDLFSGAGGLSLGLISAGFESVLAADFCKHSVETYKLNIGRILECDLTKISAVELRREAGISAGDIQLVCGGPPCQGFSVQRRGKREDSRNQLVVSFTHLAVSFAPALILIENVAGLLGVRGKAEFLQVSGILAAHGYQTKFKVLDAVNFGVPQFRARAFVLAWDPKQTVEPFFPQPSHQETTWRTVRAAIGDLPEPSVDFSEHPVFPNHKRVRISSINEERISYVPPGGGRKDIPAELQLPCHAKDNGHRHLDVYGRLHWERPSGTITAVFDNFTRGRFAHPEQNRSITAREGARLQSFPDTFRFIGPKKDVARQIGNAVPPLLSRAIGNSLISALEGRVPDDGTQRRLPLAVANMT